jgi:hypothetical protein
LSDRANHLLFSADAAVLNGENEMLLTPTVDHLFDRGFIRFENNGVADHFTSRASSLTSADGYRHLKSVNVRVFTSGQKQFLDFRRNAVLLQSIRS